MNNFEKIMIFFEHKMSLIPIIKQYNDLKKKNNNFFLNSRMNYSKKEIKQLIDAREFTVHARRPKDKLIYKSETYKIWWLVYDSNNVVVRNFYVCSICNKMEQIIQGAQGNSKLRRHKCFKDYLEGKAEGNEDDSDENSDDNEIFINSSNADLLTNSMINILARAFSEFGNLRHLKRTLKIEEIKEILPIKWDDNCW